MTGDGGHGTRLRPFVKKRGGGRGFVLTMDVIVALVIASFLFSTIMFFMSRPRPKSQEYLYSLALDFLTVADKDGSILEAVDGDPGRINEYLFDVQSSNLCLNLTVLDAAGAGVFSNSTGCPPPIRQVIGKRTVVNNSRNYVARLRVWYR